MSLGKLPWGRHTICVPGAQLSYLRIRYKIERLAWVQELVDALAPEADIERPIHVNVAKTHFVLHIGWSGPGAEANSALFKDFAMGRHDDWGCPREVDWGCPNSAWDNMADLVMHMAELRLPIHLWSTKWMHDDGRNQLAAFEALSLKLATLRGIGASGRIPLEPTDEDFDQACEAWDQEPADGGLHHIPQIPDGGDEDLEF
jgi:hypothetical protein